MHLLIGLENFSSTTGVCPVEPFPWDPEVHYTSGSRDMKSNLLEQCKQLVSKLTYLQIQIYLEKFPYTNAICLSEPFPMGPSCASRHWLLWHESKPSGRKQAADHPVHMWTYVTILAIFPSTTGVCFVEPFSVGFPLCTTTGPPMTWKWTFLTKVNSKSSNQHVSESLCLIGWSIGALNTLQFGQNNPVLLLVFFSNLLLVLES